MIWLTHDLRIAPTIDQPVEERGKGAHRSTGKRERWLFEQGHDTVKIASIVGRTEAEVVKRLERTKERV